MRTLSDGLAFPMMVTTRSGSVGATTLNFCNSTGSVKTAASFGM